MFTCVSEQTIFIFIKFVFSPTFGKTFNFCQETPLFGGDHSFCNKLRDICFVFSYFSKIWTINIFFKISNLGLGFGFGIYSWSMGFRIHFKNWFPDSDPGLLFKLEPQPNINSTKIQTKIKFLHKPKPNTGVKQRKYLSCFCFIFLLP